MLNDNVEVALKRPLTEEAMFEFKKEVAILSKMQHKNIVKFYGIFEDISLGNSYLVMEYLNCGNLRDLLDKEKKNLQLVDQVEMMLSTCNGMEYLEVTNPVYYRIML